ncbi:Aspartic peptidase [Quillaja saponaria]|uniref:Aspartic peptidase n=1 Tax=Quillaja saponaria TaxID=32244 RepID=A0AAD7QAY6_QUISA|nr:Aspartic peptidase [Quillaja saponaria]
MAHPTISGTPDQNRVLAVSLFNMMILLLLASASLLGEIHGFKIALIRIDSIESPWFPKNLTLEERHQRIVELSKNHVLSLKSANKSNKGKFYNPSPNALRSPDIQVLSKIYVTQLAIGSVRYSPYLLRDTGSEDTWVQCEGYTNCFPVRGGNFAYRNSLTFGYLPCNHRLCYPKLCRNRICIYKETYLGGASTSGLIGTDTLAFPTDTGTSQIFNNFAFGCGLDNQNMYFGGNRGPNNVIAGILGLGASRRSILMQLVAHTNDIFSYCLPSWTSPEHVHTYLRFGNDAQIRSEAERRLQTARLVPGITRYKLYLVDISIAGKRLQLEPSLFSGGFYVDTGAGPSLLARSVYRRVRAEMVEYFQRQHRWRPIKSVYDLCYANSIGSSNQSLPSMTFHFDGASLALGPANFFNIFQLVSVWL